MIFEGSSEIMRLFIAREALDPHLKVGGAIFNTQLPMSERAKADVQLRQILRRLVSETVVRRRARASIERSAQRSAGACRTTRRGASKRLARGLFHAMARFGPKLDREQLLLSRFCGVATELFAISATCSFAQAKINPANQRQKFSRSPIIFAARPGCASIIIWPERKRMPIAAVTISRRN